MMYKKIELLTNAISVVAEGPLWDHISNTLYYVDIQGKTLRKLDYSNGKIKDTVFPQQLGTIAFTKDGRLLGAMEDGIYYIDTMGGMKPAHLPIKIEGFRFNDGKVGPDGRFYAGTISRNNLGAFYSLDSKGKIEKLFGNVGNSNGLDWDENKKLFYYNDTPTRRTDVYSYSEIDGSVDSRKLVRYYDAAMGCPDGMTMDSEGMLWVALWGGWQAVRINPDNGEILNVIKLPVANVACCAFAGDDLKDLVITTASHNTDLREQPLAGSVFKVRVDVPGRLPYRFG